MSPPLFYFVTKLGGTTWRREPSETSRSLWGTFSLGQHVPDSAELWGASERRNQKLCCSPHPETHSSRGTSASGMVVSWPGGSWSGTAAPGGERRGGAGALGSAGRTCCLCPPSYGTWVPAVARKTFVLCGTQCLCGCGQPPSVDQERLLPGATLGVVLRAPPLPRYSQTLAVSAPLHAISTSPARHHPVSHCRSLPWSGSPWPLQAPSGTGWRAGGGQLASPTLADGCLRRPAQGGRPGGLLCVPQPPAGPG